jgi:hypothetical protein
VNLRLSVAPQVNTRRSGSAEGKGRSPLGRRTAAAVANEGTAIVQVEQRESHTPGGAGGGRWGGDHGRGRAVEGKEERNPMKEEGAGREGGGGDCWIQSHLGRHGAFWAFSQVGVRFFI